MARTPKKPETRKTRARTTSPKQRTAPRVAARVQTAPRGKLARARMPARPAGVREAPAPAQDEGKYVYCIIKSDEPLTFGALGIGADPSHLQTVNKSNQAAGVWSTSRGSDWRQRWN